MQPGSRLSQALDQESVGRREYLPLRPNRTQRLDDRHQIIQSFKWITANRRRHVSDTAIGRKRLFVFGRRAQFKVPSSKASRLNNRKYSRTSSIFNACRFAAIKALMSSRP